MLRDYKKLFDNNPRIVNSYEMEILNNLIQNQARLNEGMKNTESPNINDLFEIKNNPEIPILKCYCGNPIDTENVDCVIYKLCKDHATDV